MIRVVNKRTHKPTSNDIYIGRGSPLGNPFTGSKSLSNTKAQYQSGSRTEAIQSYQPWLNKQCGLDGGVKNKKVTELLNTIYNQAKTGHVNLVCYCAPKACHGHIIKTIIDKALEKRGLRSPGFELSRDKTSKDQAKADYANAYIGYPVNRPNGLSSTGVYLEDARKQGIPTNDEIPFSKRTIAFVSVSAEGTHVHKTTDLCQKVLAAGGALIMDRPGTGYGQSHSRFNKAGEGAVHDLLGQATGYTTEGYSVWTENAKLLQSINEAPTNSRGKSKTAEYQK
jgi:hypothetical protein